MTGRVTNPRRVARTAGLLYLLTIVLGIFAEFFVSGTIIVRDPAATATNILAHRELFQLGFMAYMIEMASQVAMTSLFYILFEPVSRSVSLVAAFIGLVGCATKTVARLFYIVPLFVLGSGHSLGAFNANESGALASLLLQVNDQGAGVALVFFGLYALLQGYLILRSSFLPRALGVLSLLGGVGWLSFLYPSMGHRLFFFIAPIGLLGALALILWLLVVGVNEIRWNEQAASGGSG